MVRSIDIAEDGAVAVTVSLTTAGCPIRNHFADGGQARGGHRRRRRRASTSPSTCSPTPRRARCRRSSAAARCPPARSPQVANVVCVGSGKGGVGKSTLTANLAAALAADGKKVGILDADVWGYSIPRMFGLGGERPPVYAGAQDHPARGPRREGHVDRLLRRGGRGRRLARPDAAQGADAVPRGRRLGRAGLPARRPAAGHRRRLDDARAAAAGGAVPHRHDAAADGAEGRAPRGRDGGQGRPRDLRRRREHGRLHDARPASASRSSARAAVRSSPTSSTSRCSARSR